MNMLHTTSGKSDYDLRKDYSFFVGQPVRDLDLSDIPLHRILKGNCMMTMDYRIDRLNIFTDDNDVVVKVTWG